MIRLLFVLLLDHLAYPTFTDFCVVIYTFLLLQHVLESYVLLALTPEQSRTCIFLKVSIQLILLIFILYILL